LEKPRNCRRSHGRGRRRKLRRQRSKSRTGYSFRKVVIPAPLDDTRRGPILKIWRIGIGRNFFVADWRRISLLELVRNLVQDRGLVQLDGFLRGALLRKGDG